MAFTVNLYTLAKKKNSTEVPASVAVSFTNCMIKEGCGIVNPTIGIDNGLTWNPSAYNYAAIPAFNRFYYVTDWYFDRGRWWANMTVDVLATYKTTILSNTAYVARASKSYDGTIADSLFPAKAISEENIVYWPGNVHTPWVRSFSEGFYVIGIINSEQNNIGGISYYAFTNTQFASFKEYLLGDTTWTGILDTNPDFGDNLYKSLFNPYQYITTINWFPLSWVNSWGTSVNSIKFGWWELSGISCYKLTTQFNGIGQSLAIPKHPQSDARGKYLNSAPFSKYRLFAPPFGEFELDGSIIVNGIYSATSTNIGFVILVDFISGSGTLEVYSYYDANTPVTLLRTQAIVAVPIQIAQINNNGWGSIRNIVETSVSTLTSAFSADVGGVIANSVTGIMNGIELRIPHVQEKGSNGSISAYRANFQIECVFSIMADDALADKGRPLCQEVPLGTLYPGYVQTVGAHVEIAGTETEIEQINGYLDGGVYLE